ncbi:hypothetical protein T439DRAFT_356403 [Meredithblackwellia eburnea MCA 4105]
MNAEELEQYEYQLSQIKLALAKDPGNQEYINLRDELTSLVEMTKEYLASAAPAPASTSTSSSSKPSTSSSKSAGGSTSKAVASGGASKPKPTPAAPAAIPASTLALKAGDECQARYSGDGKWYPARITSIGGSDSHRVFSVIFHGYDSTELVSATEVKSLTETKKRQIELTEEEKEKERKRKKNEKKAETKAEKQKEQGERQKSWQSFAKKAVKKGAHVPGMTGESMFRSPADGNPNAKVGVVGSGKGMTKTDERKRQTFNNWAD